MSNEPKNPYDYKIQHLSHDIWQEGYDARAAYLCSLVGEKGREALAKSFREVFWFGRNHPKPGEVVDIEKMVYAYADSLTPIIGGIVSEQVEIEVQQSEEAIRKETSYLKTVDRFTFSDAPKDFQDAYNRIRSQEYAGGGGQ